MPENAFNLAQALWDERAALEGEQLPSAQAGARIAALNDKQFSALTVDDLPSTYRRLNADNRWALCLSGGGIRSAAFALGIVQFFASQKVVSKRNDNATERLLEQFEYLSTVSGGGYIGSWLSAWLYQAHKTLVQTSQTVLRQLNERIGDHHETDPITNLRRNSHYLAPKFSALSPDIWSDIAA